MPASWPRLQPHSRHHFHYPASSVEYVQPASRKSLGMHTVCVVSKVAAMALGMHRACVCITCKPLCLFVLSVANDTVSFASTMQQHASLTCLAGAPPPRLGAGCTLLFLLHTVHQVCEACASIAQ
jgi:hypothetical protein